MRTTRMLFIQVQLMLNVKIYGQKLKNKLICLSCVQLTIQGSIQHAVNYIMKDRNCKIYILVDTFPQKFQNKQVNI